MCPQSQRNSILLSISSNHNQSFYHKIVSMYLFNITHFQNTVQFLCSYITIRISPLKPKDFFLASLTIVEAWPKDIQAVSIQHHRYLEPRIVVALWFVSLKPKEYIHCQCSVFIILIKDLTQISNLHLFSTTAYSSSLSR